MPHDIAFARSRKGQSVSNHNFLFSSFLMVPLLLAVALSSLGGRSARAEVADAAGAESVDRSLLGRSIRPAADVQTPASTAVQAGVYATIDDAIAAAFDSASRGPGPAWRARLQFGTVRRVEGGYVFTPPVRSQESVHATSPMRVRLRLLPEDVAVYGLHPRSGQADLDRLNESISAHERRLVAERDPMHRPLYVLTPSRRILRHPEIAAPIDVVSGPAIRAEGRAEGRFRR